MNAFTKFFLCNKGAVIDGFQLMCRCYNHIEDNYVRHTLTLPFLLSIKNREVSIKPGLHG